VSLRTFLVFVTLLGVTLGTWIIPSLNQRQAVRAIESMGGEVVYDIEPRDPTKEDGAFKIRTPSWLVDGLGNDFFYSVKKVRYNGYGWPKCRPPLNLDVLVLHLKRFPKCCSLELSFAGVRDDDIAKLTPLAGQLEFLGILEFKSEYACGSGLVHIKDWPRLKSLWFKCLKFQSLDLSSLSTCPKLEVLSLSGEVDGGKLEETDFTEIAKCQGITRLHLSKCSFKGSHLAQLQSLKSLETLILLDCRPRVASEPSATARGEKQVSSQSTGSFDFEQDGSSSSYEFPIERYHEWRKRILPDVEIYENYSLT